ncbi:hypothetical protein LFL96_26635 [Paraburkholderia sp. D15]|uniref:hypothetical protein n=1 Tax=Paraburkholderia sp. D15 TaxID=2880218 RepID=UPI0024786E62|nr:hypothetical protein [Paraburkholderia sp. D15]WGS54589.1 hypothetical protein LFL96_26635 [Paraburkholderia sp. D15]
MNRPLALIQGDLALPNARLLSGLPPPFGLRKPGQAAERHEPRAVVSSNLQRSLQSAMERGALPAQQISVARNAKHVFLYKLPVQHAHANRFDAQLAEARRYLDSARARPRSSRADHVVGAVIFLGCSIALAWLLATCTTRPDGKGKMVATARAPVAPSDGSSVPGSKPTQVLELAQSAQTTPSTESTEPALPRARVAHFARSAQQSVRHAEPTPAVRDSRSNVEKPPRPAKPLQLAQPAQRSHVGRLSQAQVDKRLAAIRAIPSLTRPSVSAQPEWTALISPLPPVGDSAERAALLDWAARQRSANVVTRAAAPGIAPVAAQAPARTTTATTATTNNNTDWNASMSQRRITDNPGAFQARNGPP